MSMQSRPVTAVTRRASVAAEASSRAMTVLIVDDNADVRRVIRRVIADLASEIHECANGAEGLFLFGSHRPDWVLMDIQMPGGDGLDVTRHHHGLLATDAHLHRHQP